jgi:hypothetical protein
VNGSVVYEGSGIPPLPYLYHPDSYHAVRHPQETETTRERRSDQGDDEEEADNAPREETPVTTVQQLLAAAMRNPEGKKILTTPRESRLRFCCHPACLTTSMMFGSEPNDDRAFHPRPALHEIFRGIGFRV